MRGILGWLLLAGCSSGSPSNGVDAGADMAMTKQGSAGCTNGAPAVPLDEQRMLTAGGVSRAYKIHVPASYVAGKPTPLIFDFHGSTPTAMFPDPAGTERDISKMVAKSDAAGFIVLHPQGLVDPNGDATWNAGSCCSSDSTRDDVGFVTAVLDAVEAELCIDPKRVYAAGYSNGAFMAYRLACEVADRFAAVAPVAGFVGVPCTPSRPVSVIHFHGTSDPSAPYSQVAGTIAGWVSRDNCSGTAMQTFANGDSTCQTYGCAQGTEVELCTVDMGGHAWPGGLDVSSFGLGKTTYDLIADDALWDFFVKHPLE